MSEEYMFLIAFREGSNFIDTETLTAEVPELSISEAAELIYDWKYGDFYKHNKFAESKPENNIEIIAISRVKGY